MLSVGTAGVLSVSTAAAAGDWRHGKIPHSSSWIPSATSHQPPRYQTDWHCTI